MGKLTENPWMPWGRKTREEIVAEACAKLKRDVAELRARTQNTPDSYKDG